MTIIHRLRDDVRIWFDELRRDRVLRVGPILVMTTETLWRELNADGQSFSARDTTCRRACGTTSWGAVPSA